MSSANPTRVYDCGCYFEVRDLLSHNVIVSLEQSCGHAFGAATVQPDESGKGNIYNKLLVIYYQVTNRS